jgi:hypothetical protein
MLVVGVGLRRIGAPQVARTERTGHCHIHCQSITTRPKWDSHITRSATGGITKNTLLLQDWVEHSLVTHLSHEITNSVVANDIVPIPCAARGMIAELINGLLAQGTGDFPIHHPNTQPILHRSPKHLRLHHCIHPIVSGRHRCNPGARMQLRKPCEPLPLPLAARALH